MGCSLAITVSVTLTLIIKLNIIVFDISHYSVFDQIYKIQQSNINTNTFLINHSDMNINTNRPNQCI